MNRIWKSRDEQGAVLVMATAGMVLAVISAALAIDLGGVAQAARHNQKVADMAALDASRSLPATDAALTSVAQATAGRNNFTVGGTNTVTAVVGTKSGGLCTANPGAASVCVTVTSNYSSQMPYVKKNHTVTRTAQAGLNGSEAEFSVGSTLASLDTQKSFLDSYLGSKLGVSMSAVSYSGIAGGNVTLAALQTQLASLGYSVGTPTDLLNANVKVKDLLTATAGALTAQGNSTAAAAVNNIPIASISSTLTMHLGQLVSLASPSSTSALSTSINAFQLVNGSAQVQNGSSFVTIPGIAVTVPLLGGLTVGLRVISPAQIAQGPVGTTASNAQIVLQLKFNLTVAGLLGVAAVTLNEANATAVGTLTAIQCAASPGITISTATGALTTSGDIVTGVANLTISGSAAGTTATPHDFAYTSGFGAPAGTLGTYWETGVSTVGINNAVTVSGTGLLGPATALLVQPVLNTTLPLLNTALTPILKPILQALGANLSAADVTAMDIFPAPPACGRPSLLK